MRAMWLIGIVAAVCVGTAAYAKYGEYFPGLRISDNPSAAEQRAFMEAMYKGWDVNVELGNDNDALCADLDKEMKAGNVTYLEPEAFGKTEKPAAVKDIEKQCPYLHLGLSWNTGRDGAWQEKSEEEMTSIYGEPFRATENFALYRVRIPGAQEPRTVFVADRTCEGGICSHGTHFVYIDERMCLSEAGYTLFPHRDDSGAKGGPALLWTMVQIRDNAYFLEAGDQSLLDAPQGGAYIRGGPGFTLWIVPGAVDPLRRYDRTHFCGFNSPAKPR